jgi:hypothetical protein
MQHPHPPRLGMQFDPLEGVRIDCVFVDAAGGDLQAVIVWVGGEGALHVRVVQMAAQDQVAVQTAVALGLAGIEFGQIVPGVVQQGDCPVGSFCSVDIDGLLQLPSAEQQLVAVAVAAGHPGGVEPGDVQALVVDDQHALPPGQRLLGVEPGSIEAEVGGVTFEQGLALARIAEHRGNPLLVTTGEESGLDHLGDRIDAFAVDIVVAGHQQQPISVQCRRRVRHQRRPELRFQPALGQLVLMLLAAEREIAGADHQIRDQPRGDIVADPLRQMAQDRVGIPAAAFAEMDVGQVEQAYRPGTGRA